MEGAAGFELLRRPPGATLSGLARALTGYRETRPAAIAQREAAPLSVPLIVSLGTPFRIALGAVPDEADRQPSFAAGLHPGPVEIRSDGGAECVQLDLTPLGACRLFGPALPAITGRMVDLAELFGAEGRALTERIGNARFWQARLDLLEGFVAARLIHAPTPAIAFAWRRLGASGGTARIGELASEIGWSRKHLAARFRAEIGLGPKTVARMLRFHRACRLALSGGEGWAGIAAACSYADQAHLVRDFAEFAGEPPSAWARRVAGLNERLRRAPEDG